MVFTVFATKWEATRVSRWRLQRFHVLLDLFQGFEQDHIPNDRISTLFTAYTKPNIHTRMEALDLGSLAGPTTGQQLLAAGFWTEGLLYGSCSGQLR